MFQYKIIHNILPTKASLFKAKICDDDICPQCFADRHSLDHMFLHCQLTLSFCDLFQTWWTSKSKENVTLTDTMILYGIFDNREHLYSLNYSLLIANALYFLKQILKLDITKFRDLKSASGCQIKIFLSKTL